MPPYYNSYQSQFHYPIENRADPYAPSTLTSNRVDPYAPSASASTSNSSPPSDYTPSDYQPTAEYPSTNIADEDRKLIPSQNLIPPAEQAPNTAYNQNTFQAVKKPKKKPPQTDDDNDDQDGKFYIKLLKTSDILYMNIVLSFKTEIFNHIFSLSMKISGRNIIDRANSFKNLF